MSKDNKNRQLNEIETALLIARLKLMEQELKAINTDGLKEGGLVSGGNIDRKESVIKRPK